MTRIPGGGAGCRPFAALLAAALAAFSSPADAQTRCGPRDAIIAHLGTKYGEQQRAVGMQGPGQVLELYANAETGTWTIITTDVRGLSCLRAAGGAFQAIEPDEDEGEPS